MKRLIKSKISLAIMVLSLYPYRLLGQDDALINLAIKPASISEMDWILLKAGIESRGVSSRISFGSFYYNPQNDRIEAIAVFAPDFLKTGSVESVKRSLEDVAIAYLVNVFNEVERKTKEKWSNEKQFKHFYVIFRTFDNKGEFYEAAIYENGKLTLK